MKDLLFLAHRIPYPPNKGDKIRSFHILKHLSERFRVHLGAFVDDADDWQFADALKPYCASMQLVPLNPKLALLRSAMGLVSGEALGIPYYRNRCMSEWATKISSSKNLAGVFVFSSTMAQYAADMPLASKVLDLCDVDSEKWRQYAERRRPPLSWIYSREARLLACEERRLADRFDAVVLVSNNEAELFKRIAPDASARTYAVRNGVDTEYFDPASRLESPFRSGERPLVFTGAMDYWANIDAVQWFADEVMPQLIAREPAIKFYIVGSRPADAVRQLSQRPNIVVTGTVADVRPYLARACAVVAPLRIARGIQNKVLEALAMARPLVATTAALDGLDGIAISGAIAADDPQAFAAAIERRLREDGADVHQARQYVCENFGWAASLQMLDSLLGASGAEGVAGE